MPSEGYPIAMFPFVFVESCAGVVSFGRVLSGFGEGKKDIKVLVSRERLEVLLR